jgi:hypothetical protein
MRARTAITPPVPVSAASAGTESQNVNGKLFHKERRARRRSFARIARRFREMETRFAAPTGHD